MNISQNVKDVKKEISHLNVEQDVTICAATKYVGIDVIRELVKHGIHHMGENIVDAFLSKYDALKDMSIKWHFIGTLQTNKVKKIINKIEYLHSLDRIRLAKYINRYREKPLNCFVQVNCSGEESKHGLNPNEVLPFIKSLQDYEKVKVVGLMTMAEDTEDEMKIRQSFQLLKKIQQEVMNLKINYAPCNELSMGMSNDYLIAIPEGATVVRIGSRLFR